MARPPLAYYRRAAHRIRHLPSLCTWRNSTLSRFLTFLTVTCIKSCESISNSCDFLNATNASGYVWAIEEPLLQVEARRTWKAYHCPHVPQYSHTVQGLSSLHIVDTLMQHLGFLDRTKRLVLPLQGLSIIIYSVIVNHQLSVVCDHVRLLGNAGCFASLLPLPSIMA